MSVTRSAFDAARGDRLAKAAEDLDARDSCMSNDEDSPVFMRVFLLHSDEIDGILIAWFPLRCQISMGLILRP